MYDPETANLLRSAPEFPGLNPDDLPQILTSHYAQIVSMRLGGEDIEDNNNEWSLDKIADTYELITSIHSNIEIRRASAFVAASAQQIIARREHLLNEENDDLPNISKERVDPSLSAILLFLAAEQYADANEAASILEIEKENQSYEAFILSQYVVNLARGNLNSIINIGKEWRDNIPSNREITIEELAVNTMLEKLAVGIEALAHRLLGISVDQVEYQDLEAPRKIFLKVQSLSVEMSNLEADIHIEISYPGIHHLASLLISTFEGISESALTNIPPPDGADPEFWQRWIRFRANKFPYVWPNHKKALDKGFHKNGVSSVMILPTGAGKTTISSIKIASVLAQGKKVIFLAPTHALVEQLTNDLQEMFPQDILGATVSSDFDLIFQINVELPEIEVMTPERCLAMLSFSSESFNDVGLLVFDECHLLSPDSGKIRRALDGMLCILAFNKIVPLADNLFLSAMIKNGEEFAQWIKSLTKRECICVDLLWKPSRQARGIVIYRETEVNQIKTNALKVQNQLNEQSGTEAKTLRAAADRELNIYPHAIWGLQHNWLNTQTNMAVCSFTKIIDDKVHISGDINFRGIHLKPNVNSVASQIAAISATNGLKTIVFVNQKSHAISAAKDIADKIDIDIIATEKEILLWDALTQEVGDLKHSLLDGPTIAVPHNASMLRLERELSERMYRREDGAKVIVATPTLAQGLNLPAQLAILAGDKRANIEQGGRESLEAHELLNAAARAGRAGHLANGIVLLVPEPILSFPEDQLLDANVVEKLQSLIPEDDRCLEISDPLGIVLDRISEGNTLDRDVKYVVNRLATLKLEDDEKSVSIFNLKNSFAAFKATKQQLEDSFTTQLNELKQLIIESSDDDIEQTLLILSTQSGLPINILSRLKVKIEHELGFLPISIPGWVNWLISWFKFDEEARNVFLYDVTSSILGATGHGKSENLTAEIMDELTPGINSWLSGCPLNEIEQALGGDPDANAITKQICPRARELISSVIPRGLSFVMGLLTRIIEEINPYETQESLSPEIIESLSTAVRLGYDLPEKLSFAFSNPKILSRVGVHQEFLHH